MKNVVPYLQVLERLNPLLHLVEVVGAGHLVQRAHKRFHGVNPLLYLCIVMLSVDVHDGIGDSLDLLSMLCNGLVSMLRGYAVRVDRPREILEGVYILCDFRKDVLPFYVKHRRVHQF